MPHTFSFVPFFWSVFVSFFLFLGYILVIMAKRKMLTSVTIANIIELHKARLHTKKMIVNDGVSE